jgi:arylsulfatase A-like enzyme
VPATLPFRAEAASDASGVAVNKRLKQWGEAIRSREPYLLFIQYMDAHAPYEPKGPWFEQFKAAPLPTSVRPAHVAAYDSEIRFVDERVQGLFEAFGWGRDTVVIVTADHGEELGDHGQTGHGQALTPELMNIPLLVYGPGFPPHRVQDPVSLVDFLPTVRELAGAPANPANEGWSLVPLLRGGRWDRPPRPLFAHLLAIGTSDVSEAVIYRDLKLVRGPGSYVGLFDLAADPQETTDIAAARRADVARLVRMLPPPGTPPRNVEIDVTSLPADLVEQLRSLGYIK